MINLEAFKIINFWYLMDKQEAIGDNRFKDFEEIFNGDGVAIGFTLPGNPYIFRYDANGGWKDEKGNQYNSEGLLINEADILDDDEDSDEEILEEFEKMLEPEQNLEVKPQEVKKTQNIDDSRGKYLNQYRNKEQIRDGLPPGLPIYFKMRADFYERVTSKVEAEQSIEGKNKLIKQLKQSAEKHKQQLIANNKWLAQKQVDLEFSGTQIDNAYDRYWFGVIDANHENYERFLEDVKNSKQFALLKSKTFYALKSKFYLKKKMQETIVGLQKQLDGLEDNDLVKIMVNNLPQNFPCSLILNLLNFSNTPLSEVYNIILIDEYSADLILSKKGALTFLNIEGYCHDEKQFIQLDIEQLKQKKKLENKGFYKIAIESDKYKIPERELHDTLLLQKSREDVAKIYNENQQKENGGYRFVVGANALKRVLMFRGDCLCVNKVEVM